MLSDRLKQQIRDIHSQLRQKLPGYRPRAGQNKLIAEISKIIAGDYHRQQRLGLIEAGTGTGKSLAYILGSLPYALAHNKKLVIATATVALQEQLVNKDLPFFLTHSSLQFNFTLVKGRQRYACIERLQQLIEQPTLFAGADFCPDAAQQALLQRLLSDWQHRRWLGDRDTLTEAVPDSLWQQLQADAHICHKQQRQHLQCPFHLARAEIADSEVLVVNHSLLLSDLLAGNAVLPAPEDCIYVIDEAHHLADCGRDLLSASAQLSQQQAWLEKARKQLQLLQGLLTERSLKDLLKLDDFLSDFAAALKPVERSLKDFLPQWFKQAEQTEYRFPHAALPRLWQQQAEPLAETSNKALTTTERLLNELQQQLTEQPKLLRSQPQLIHELASLRLRLEQQQQLWQLLAQPQKDIASQARWLSRTSAQSPLYLHACPLSVSYKLQQLLFQPAFAVVLCSATLRLLNSFEHAKRELGLLDSDALQCLQVDSPFAYAEQAEIILPPTRCEPTDPTFSQELIRLLPGYLDHPAGTLVLFASYWQMQEVASALRSSGFSILVQGEASRQALLQLHQEKVQAGGSSILFGTQSFAEGLDLPGKLLTNLIITKLPFAVPTSPLEAAQSEAISARGGNAFLQQSLPATAKKLVQACGRLLRQEQDHGRIVILDRRLVTKSYGKAMLDTLPPFRRTIQY
ncbi:MAG: ATP-dependent DNA helicase DinG [Alishewanella aestuarii]